MASWTLEVTKDCDFAGIPLQRGMIMVVRPGHPTRPITVQLDLPPNYGMILNLLADDAVIERDAFAEIRDRPREDREAPPIRRRRHLTLVP